LGFDGLSGEFSSPLTPEIHQVALILFHLSAGAAKGGMGVYHTLLRLHWPHFQQS